MFNNPCQVIGNEGNPTYGNLNNDGVIDAKDAISVLKYAVGKASAVIYHL